MVLVVKNPPANAGDIRDVGSIPGSGRSLERAMVTHSGILAWRIPWTGEPGGLENNALYPPCIGFDILKIISTEMNSVLKKLTLGICRGDLNLGHQEVAEHRGAVLVAQSSPTLCGPMDCSPPGSSVHGVLQATILEWVSMPFSRGSSRPMNRTNVSCIEGKFFTI